MKPATLFLRQKFLPDEFPQLYSKRGFEKSRISCIIPKDRNGLAFIIEKKSGYKLNIDL